MSDCIVCGKPLSPAHEWLNLNFHSHCAQDITKFALKLLEGEKVNQDE